MCRYAKRYHIHYMKDWRISSCIDAKRCEEQREGSLEVIKEEQDMIRNAYNLQVCHLHSDAQYAKLRCKLYT